MRPIIAYPGVAGKLFRGCGPGGVPGGRMPGLCDLCPRRRRRRGSVRRTMRLLPIENSFAGAVLPTYGVVGGFAPAHCGRDAAAGAASVGRPCRGLPGRRTCVTISSHPAGHCPMRRVLIHAVTWMCVWCPRPTRPSAPKEVAGAGRPDPCGRSPATRGGGALRPGRAARTTSRPARPTPPASSSSPGTETPLAAPDKATGDLPRQRRGGRPGPKVLASFAENGLNMSRIESRPLPDTPFQYFFSADFVGSMDAPHLRSAMDAAPAH